MLKAWLLKDSGEGEIDQMGGTVGFYLEAMDSVS